MLFPEFHVHATNHASQGLLDVGKIKAGETLVVSGAAGSVGSVACQIGKIFGAKVIGIAGSDDKCRWLTEELKIDAALNYKSPTFQNEFKHAVGYLDVFFDNVGGEILDLALTRLNKGARIALCGESTRAQYIDHDHDH
jgi:NADPH-dependent curcumin reductase CurA